MSLAPGTRIGPYEVVSMVGVGGMGEVYRATDTRLKRQVAVKILPSSLAANPDRLARSQREAEVLASLNHPNIAAIYGLEDAGSVKALIMELVEGPTLADRISRAPIPMDEALPIARQIADAVEVAHEQGIIHRDLKPANIKIRVDGIVKVLDFGLAKALEPIWRAGAEIPTMTSPALTGMGVILGTAAYMSPEQARGRPLDKRTDIWAFGVVLYEMLTGAALFSGDTITDILAAIATREPDFGALPPRTPARVRDLLRRCLIRDPKQRLQAIGEARIALDAALAEPPGAAAEPGMPDFAARWRRTGLWAIGIVVVAIAGTLLASWPRWPIAAPPAPIRVSADLGAEVSLALTDGHPGGAVVLSPDGGLLLFVAKKGTAGTAQLYLRRLDQLAAAPLSGTEGGVQPFFSADARWIGFFADGKLKKVSVTGGPAVTLCDAPDPRGGAWAEDGTIVFSPKQVGVGLSRVSESGGTPEPLTSLDDGEVTHRWPQVLPGAKAVLYTAHSSYGGDFQNANLVVRPLASGSSKVVQRGGHYGRYFASGHLAYVHDGTLFAAAFDLERLEVTSESVPVLEGVAVHTVTGGAHFAAATTGIVVYLPGHSVRNDAPIHWIDRQGRATPLRTTAAPWSNLRFSPDGRRVVLEISDGREADIWVYEWERDALSRLTTDSANDTRPVWTPDGSRIVFSSTRGNNDGRSNLYWQRFDASGAAERLTESTDSQSAASWHPSGRFLAFHTIGPNRDIMILPMQGNDATGWKPGKAAVFLNAAFAEVEPMFSPDGQWIAYASDETGQVEIYVRPFPGPGSKSQISTAGGAWPVWSRTRQELLYQARDGQIMIAPYTVDGETFQVQRSRPWPQPLYGPSRGGRPFDLHPDGDRVALAAAPPADAEVSQDKVVFIFNFFEELRRIAPGKGGVYRGRLPD